MCPKLMVMSSNPKTFKINMGRVVNHFKGLLNFTFSGLFVLSIPVSKFTLNAATNIYIFYLKCLRFFQEDNV